MTPSATYLVTGVAGFIGSHLAQALLHRGHNVVGVDDLSTGKRENVPVGVEFITADLADADAIAVLPLKVDAIAHLAGQSSGEMSFDNPVGDLERNTVSTLNLLCYARESGAQRIVAASSMSVYGDVADAPTAESTIVRPKSCYGIGKLAAEQYLHVFRHEVPYTAMRMFNVYGPGQNLDNLRQGMVSIYVAMALRDGVIEVRGGLDRFRDFVHVDDVVAAWVAALCERDPLNDVVNVATGVRTTVRELLDIIVDRVPGTQVREAAGTPGDQLGIFADISRARALLGWEPRVALHDGVTRFVEWARGR
jgi:UDP-glucose 4-epimerase